ncbi:hypothetical protein FHS04_002231 [Mesoflavibacter sabulilitoris]|uniref:Uncharacterized protein n=1 Tax=Mesoflavibacter zeaxanthinifaciens subsp. sabulilitoris TaxID=1520893 RepID=A0A2T1NMH5_9FLAO|nr:hypothetical protein [Mesoflavibacter zeaxanthinifaciens]MBB3124708.1 hypothetical protein [Mesoflavibacter zeaxanthinifaciens subsp. sabulilitoris]PSG94071.1 hypothetical protein C7H61_02515 [Mesoflavibacter zeaxanthinifaciens subsp. sabulilitoris]
MRRILLLISFFAIVFTVQNVNAQNNRKLKTQPVKYGDNLEAPFTAKELGMLEEVYQDKLEKYVLSRPQKIKDLKHLLRNRLLITKLPHYNSKSKVTLLSTVGLFNNYNKELKRDQSFDINTFNPLKYNLEFFKVGSAIYRIDNTQYYIVIKAQNLKK